MRMPLMIALLGLLFGGCNRPPQTGMGFYLPAGDAQRGKVAFVELKCNGCHTVSGVDLPAAASRRPTLVQLGGDVTRVRSYGDLVTSIIYPSRTVSDLIPLSERDRTHTMPEVAGNMTVVQLVDVVTFLQPHYRRAVPNTYTVPPL